MSQRDIRHMIRNGHNTFANEESRNKNNDTPKLSCFVKGWIPTHYPNYIREHSLVSILQSIRYI